MQVVEPKIPFLRTMRGTASSVRDQAGALVHPDGLDRRHREQLLLDSAAAGDSARDITEACSATALATLAGCGAYLSFSLSCMPDQYIPAGDMAGWYCCARPCFPMVGFLTHELAEANRVAARKHQSRRRTTGGSEPAVCRKPRPRCAGPSAWRRSDSFPRGWRTKSAIRSSTIKALGRNAAQERGRRQRSGAARWPDSSRARWIAPMRWSRASSISRGRWRCIWRKPSLRRGYRPSRRRSGEAHAAARRGHLQKLFARHSAASSWIAQLMERVLYNLLLNAAQASPPQRERHGEDPASSDDDSGDRGDRPRLRHRSEGPGEHFQSVLHHQVGRRRAGSCDRVQDRRRAWRARSTVESESGRGQRVSHLPSRAVRDGR